MTSPRLLILASASPRRAELLTSAGFRFTVQPAHVDESVVDGEPPADYVLRVARAKAQAVASMPRPDDSIILAADTAVVVERCILGKPRDTADARRMLTMLAGGVHEVLTGVVAAGEVRVLAEVVTTRVRLIKLTAGEIESYLTTGEHRDKAGGYAIQGYAARFIDWIEGSWSNVVGLPLATVHRFLSEAGGSHMQEETT